MLTASDGYAYVVKFANNPQSLRILANEWLACSIGRAIGLTIPEPAILYVPAKLVECTLDDLRMIDPNDRSPKSRLVFRPDSLRESGVPEAIIEAAAQSHPQG